MKPNFALSLSFDGLRLMHRAAGGWHLVGQVALDDADMTGALGRLRAAADVLEPGGISTKLLIPNDQIKYIALDTTRADEDDVREALHGATPYAVSDLAYDFAKGGGRTYVAAVAKETLDEAQQFAREYGFNPVSYAAVPEPFTFVGEAFFGGIDGAEAERDAEPVVVIGTAEVEIEPAPEPAVEPVAEAEPADETPAAAEPEVEEPAAEEPEAAAPVVEETPEAEFIPDPIPDAEPEAAEPEPEPDTASEPEPEQTPEPVSEPEPTPEPESDLEPIAISDLAEEADAAPVFASRLRADRNEGRPTAPIADSGATVPPTRTEPTFGRQTPPTLAVPTGKGTDAMPPLSAPSRDAAPAPAAPQPITIDTVEPKVAPAITGEAPTALPPEAAVAAASLTIEPDERDEEDAPEPEGRSAAATALGAVGAVGGAVGGMFASRRMAREEAKQAQEDAPAKDAGDEKSRLTVFGARKKPAPKPKQVVGGKPRFLGLILTAVLLLFLLAIAAFAALSEDGIAGWFGFGKSDTQMAADPSDTAAPEVAALAPSGDENAPAAPDALAVPTAPTGGQVLTPEEAERIYAATGVWQRAPRIPLIPRTTTLENMTLSVMSRPVVRVPASPLADASSVAGDAVIAAPVNPPPASAVFDFGDDGRIVATAEGAVTPDGILVIAGRPALEPPVRPGTVAPEVTPQDQIAAVIPETAQTVTDAPEGVIVIAGAPSLRPPVRTAPVSPVTVVPDVAAVLPDSPEGVNLIAGPPPILPPVRPGTVAATQPEAIAPEAPATDSAATDVATTDPTLPEGLNVIAGSPPVLPPARPGTVAPQEDAAVQDDVDSLTQDIAAALNSGTAQVPTANTRRPAPRPESIAQIAAAAVAADTPILGALTVAEAASFRPRTRPAGLAPVVEEVVEEPVVEDPVVAAPAAPTGLLIAPEIAAAVEAAANRPNPIINPTAQAVPVSSRPDPRPRNMERIVARANEAQQRAATQVASVAPRAVAPSGPTGSAVAQNATLENAINLRDVNLIGIYGGSNDRRALVRLGNGRYVRVTVGDRLDGGQVTAISAGALSYTKRGRAITLQVPG